MGTLISKPKSPFRQRAVVLLLGMLLLVASGCRANPPASPASSVTASPVSAPVPGTGPSVSESAEVPILALSGEVRSKDEVTLAAKLSGRIIELKVAVGDRVKKNDLLVVLEHEAADVQIKQAEASLAAVEATIKGAQAQLALLQAGAAREQLAVAEAAIRGAEANLALLQAGATREQIAAAEAGLAAAQARMDLVLAGARPEQLSIAEFQVEMAKEGVTLTDQRTSTYPPPGSFDRIEVYMHLRDVERQLARMQADLAKSQLDLLKLPPRPEEVAQLKAAVDGAKAQLEALKAPPRPQQVAQAIAGIDAAKAQMEVLKAPLRPQQVAQLEAAIDGVKAQLATAQASLQLARIQRDEAFLYSPADGVVTSKSLSVGSLASPGSAIMGITSRDVEVVIAVDEIQLRQVSVGQAVSITATAYPGDAFTGKVRVIALGGNASTRTFDVFIDPQDPKGLLRPGMSTTVTLSKGA